MISLQEYKKICIHKNKSGFVHYIEGEFSIIDLGSDDEILMEVIYKLGIIANKEIGMQCYILKDHLSYINIIYDFIKKDSFVLVIDGMCGAGKSTLADILEKTLNANVFHMDDFYLPLEKKTKERLSQPAGHIDHERFIEVVLKPISLKQEVYYQPYLCSCNELSNEITVVEYNRKIIIEGSYTLKPELLPYYTDMLVLKIEPHLQKERLIKRNPNNIKQFEEKWIPLENQYFDYYHIFEKYKVLDIY